MKEVRDGIADILDNTSIADMLERIAIEKRTGTKARAPLDSDTKRNKEKKGIRTR